MSSFDSEKRFLELGTPEYFTRVDDKHQLDLWVGVDSLGRKAVRFIGSFKTEPIQETNAIKIKQFELSDKKVIQFSLADETYSPLFYRFCDDLVESSRLNATQQEGYAFVVGRFQQWRKMFGGHRNLLGEFEVMALIGELRFLQKMISDYGPAVALKAWTGPEPTLKDFSIGGTWCEVKTVGAKSKAVKIGSLEQLESDVDGFLAVYRLEKMSPSFKGLTLNGLVADIASGINNQLLLSLFYAKLDKVGYDQNEKYDEYVYSIKEESLYEVRDGFPRLTKNSVAKSISAAEYEIRLDGLDPFKGAWRKL